MLLFISAISGAVAMFMTLITIRALVQAIDARLMCARVDTVFFLLMTVVVGCGAHALNDLLVIAAIMQIIICVAFMRDVRRGFKRSRIPQAA